MGRPLPDLRRTCLNCCQTVHRGTPTNRYHRQASAWPVLALGGDVLRRLGSYVTASHSTRANRLVQVLPGPPLVFATGAVQLRKRAESYRRLKKRINDAATVQAICDLAGEAEMTADELERRHGIRVSPPLTSWLRTPWPRSMRRFRPAWCAWTASR
jgi:hypothetical protein